ncbi:MAG: S1 RNA-binding domain-containing protein [Planctomycetota bacterium]|nr:S1 RNA-binding domain-containing protein [Planctomycetota bacterium]
MNDHPEHDQAPSSSEPAGDSVENTPLEAPQPPNSGVERPPGPEGAAKTDQRSMIDGDLDAEIAAALGDASIDQLMEEQEATAPTVKMSSDGRRTRSGVVVAIHEDNAMIEFGPKSQGICPCSQFRELKGADPEVGSTCDFVVERFDPFEGMLIVSLPGAVQKADWGTLEEGQIIEARCIGVNRGGLEMEVNKHRGFMPSGQVDTRHVPDISIFIGEKMTCKVIELKKNKDRLVLSRKAVVAVERAKQRETLLSELAEGQVRTATVTSIQPYGAFADLGGIDGLIHVSDIAHERIKDPSSVLSVGDTLEVQVMKIDTTGKEPRIGLSRKEVMTNPVAQAMEAIEEGAEVTGTVKKLTDFGAFVEIAPGLEGLVHISQLAHERVQNVQQILKKNEVVQVKILSIDKARNRVSLSIKALTEPPKRAESDSGRRGRGPAESQQAREEDPEMRKLKARFSSNDLKGGLG